MNFQYILNGVVIVALFSIDRALLADSKTGVEQTQMSVETKDNKNLLEGQQSWETDLDENHDQELEDLEHFKRSQSWIAGYGKRFTPYYSRTQSGKPNDLNNKRMQSWAAGYGKRSTANIKRLQAWLTTFGKRSSDSMDQAARIEGVLSRYDKWSSLPNEIDKKLQSWMSGYGKRMQSWMTGYGKKSINDDPEEKKISDVWNSRYGDEGYGEDVSDSLDYPPESDKRSQGWTAMYGKRNMKSGYFHPRASRMLDVKRSSGQRWFVGYGKRAPKWFVGYGKRGPNWFVGYGKRGTLGNVGYGKGLFDNDLEPGQNEDKLSSSLYAGNHLSEIRERYEKSDDSTFTDSSQPEHDMTAETDNIALVRLPGSN